MATKLSRDQVEAARTQLVQDSRQSIRSIAVDLGVNESTLRRRLSAGRDDQLSHDIDPGFVEVPVIIRDYSHLTELYTYPLGDVHIGSPAHQGGRWQQWLAFLSENEDTSMIALGDMINASVIGSKGDTYAETHTVQEAKWKLIEDLRPLAEANRVDAITEGNHENRVYRLTGEDPMLDVSRVLGIPHFSAAAFIVYLVGDQRYTTYLRHGTGNGQSLAGLEKSATVADADLYITGHTHRIAVTAKEKFVVEQGVTVRKRQYFASSGSFLAMERYAAERGYPPSRLGAPRIHMNGTRKDLHVSI